MAVGAKTACGVVAGPVFAAFTVIGARRERYDWKRHAVSSLAAGPGGWAQRANFIGAGALYCVAARGLARAPRGSAGPAVVPALVGGVGIGLVGSGVFATDPVAGFPPSGEDPDTIHGAPTLATTLEGRLDDLCAIPIFIGIPTAALISAGSAARRREFGWAACCVGSAVGMPAAFALFGAALAGRSGPAGRSGIFQRLSIATGFGWLSALSLRAFRQSRRADVHSPRTRPPGLDAPAADSARHNDSSPSRAATTTPTAG